MKTMLSVGAAALLAIAGQASAVIIYNSNGFEAPQFALGNIDGQDGWAVDPPLHTNHQVVGTTTVGANTINPQAGSQMVQIGQTTANRFSFPDITAGVGTRPLGEDWILSKMDILAPSGQTSTGFFGLEAFNAAGTLLAAARLRASDGLVVVTLDPDGPGANTFNNYSIGLSAPLNTWVNLGVAINVLTNQVAITSGNSVLIAGTTQTPTANATLSDFDLFSPGSATLTNSMFVDNYFVYSDTSAPAPGAAGLLGLGGLLVARRRR